MSIESDEKLMATLRALSIEPSQLIDIGGEAAVFRFGDDRVARIGHDWMTREQVETRAHLLRELSASAFPFRIPSVQEILCPAGRFVTIEPFLSGITLQRALETAAGEDRRSMIEGALNASLAFASCAFERPFYSDIFWEPKTEHVTWRGFLAARAAKSLALAGERFAHVDVTKLAAPFEESPQKSFVHFDLYPGNLLIEDGQVTAVLDFGGMSVCGDARFDPLSLAVYLSAEMTRFRKPSDADVCAEWLQNHDLLEWLSPAERVIAAIWSFAQDDQVVADWTARVLL